MSTLKDLLDQNKGKASLRVRDKSWDEDAFLEVKGLSATAAIGFNERGLPMFAILDDSDVWELYHASRNN